MSKVLVIYYSRSGNTESMARAAADGCKLAGAQVQCLPVAEATLDMAKNADAIIMGSPVYFGTMAAPLKEFWDESVKIRPSLEGKLGAAIATSGHHTGGKETTLLSIHQAMLIHGMIIVGDPISTGGHYGAACHGGVSDAGLKDAKALGARIGTLAQKMFG